MTGLVVVVAAGVGGYVVADLGAHVPYLEHEGGGVELMFVIGRRTIAAHGYQNRAEQTIGEHGDGRRRSIDRAIDGDYGRGRRGTRLPELDRLPVGNVNAFPDYHACVVWDVGTDERAVAKRQDCDGV